MLAFRPSTDVFLDTDLMVNAVIAGLQHSEVCRSACHELLKSGQRLCYSQIMRVEYMQAIRRLATRQQLPDSLYVDFELHRWGERHIRERWMNAGIGELHAFLDAFQVTLQLPLNDSIINRGLNMMAYHSLSSLDAVHLATALHYEIPVFWTCDDHFQRVDDLYVEVIRECR